MATRFYLLDTPTPYTPTAWRGGWDKTAGASSLACDPKKMGLGGQSSVFNSENVVTTPYRLAAVRFVSRRLAPQTISGTLNMVANVFESNAGADFYARLHVYVVNSTTNAVLGTLLNQYEESSGAGSAELLTSSGTITRALQSAQALANVTVPNDGDDYRVVFELGVRSENASATNRSASCTIGARSAGLVLGAFSDAVVGETLNTLNRKALFFEFSGTVALASDVVPHVVPEDALDITALLPYTGSFVASDGIDYSLWFKVTAATTRPFSFFGFGDLTTYMPYTVVFQGGDGLLDGGSWNGPSDTTGALILGTNVAVQVPMTAAVDYYFELLPNPGNPAPANLSIDVEGELPPDDSDPSVELLLVPDDKLGHCTVLAIDADNHVVDGFPAAPGESGDIMPASGVTALEDRVNDQIEVKAADHTLLATLAIAPSSFVQAQANGNIRANPTLNRFYAMDYFAHTLYGIEIDGSISSTFVLGDLHVLAIAVSNDASVLYYATLDDNTAIKRWDLLGNVAMADLAAGGGSGKIIDIYCLQDDTILVLEAPAATGDFVRHYSAAGATLHTYDYSAIALVETQGRLARGANDSITEFWLWLIQADAPGIARFRKIQISDGTELVDRSYAMYLDGAYNPDATATPIARFGPSPSCPFFVVREGTDDDDEEEPPPEEDLCIPGPPQIACWAGGRPSAHTIATVPTTPKAADWDGSFAQSTLRVGLLNADGT